MVHKVLNLVLEALAEMPDYFWSKIMPFYLRPAQDAKVRPPVELELHEVELTQPVTDMIATKLNVEFFELRRILMPE